MRVLFVDKAGQIIPIAPDSQSLIAAMAQETGLLWLDLAADDHDGSLEKLLTDTFGFHPLAIDDALHEIHMPKLDDWDAYLYMVLQDAVYDLPTHTLTLPELDIFLGQRFLVTYHHEALTAVERVWQSCQRDGRWLAHGPDHLLYRLIDELVNNFLFVLDTLEENLEQLESMIFTDPAPALLENLFAYKRCSLQLRRVLLPQREVVGKLARDSYKIIGPKDRIFFRDVYDHMLRLHDLSDSVHDRVMDSLNIYLSVVNNRMNDIMKTLTLITTLFMPLAFITGFFGMNFFQALLPSTFWTGAEMLAAVLALTILLPIAMFTWMRRRAWM